MTELFLKPLAINADSPMCIKCGRVPYRYPDGHYAKLCGSCGWRAILNLMQEVDDDE